MAFLGVMATDVLSRMSVKCQSKSRRLDPARAFSGPDSGGFLLPGSGIPKTIEQVFEYDSAMDLQTQTWTRHDPKPQAPPGPGRTPRCSLPAQEAGTVVCS